MFDKGKRARRQNEDDKVFNRMLLWLAAAVVLELLLLMLQKAYVEMTFSAPVAKGLLEFFKIFNIAANRQASSEQDKRFYGVPAKHRGASSLGDNASRYG